MNTMAYRAPQPPTKKGRTPPPEETFEEASYLRSLGETQQPVSVKLVGGEIVQGWIEYYDRYMIRLTREGGPNLFIFKHEIMYVSDGPLAAPPPKRTVRASKTASGLRKSAAPSAG